MPTVRSLIDPSVERDELVVYCLATVLVLAMSRGRRRRIASYTLQRSLHRLHSTPLLLQQQLLLLLPASIQRYYTVTQ